MNEWMNEWMNEGGCEIEHYDCQLQTKQLHHITLTITMVFYYSIFTPLFIRYLFHNFKIISKAFQSYLIGLQKAWAVLAACTALKY